MKNFVLTIILHIAKFGMQFLYFFIKLFPMKKNKVTMLSRQSNKVNIDFQMLIEEFQKELPNVEIKTLCKKIPNGVLGKIGYCFYMIKCMYHIATSHVCIVDGYMIPVSSLKHKDRLIIVQVWHAMGAIKQFGMQTLDKAEGSNKKIAQIMQMHKNYTFITCTSSETAKIYAEAFGTDKEKILPLGMPRIDYLLGKDEKIDKKIEQLYEDYPNLKDKKIILYVPTFRKGKQVPVFDVINSIDTEKYHLIIRMHPLDETKIDEKYTVSRKYLTEDLLKVADYVITDYSAVAFEACVLDKPIFFYLYDIQDYEENRGLNINLKEELPSRVFTNMEGFGNMIENSNYNEEEQEKFKRKYVETVDTRSSERIVKKIINIMGRND